MTYRPLYLVLLVAALFGVFAAGCSTEPTAAPDVDEKIEEAAEAPAEEAAEAPAEEAVDDQEPEEMGTVAVGSKDFTEEFIVAEMFALLLEQAGFTVDRKMNLGGTPIAHQALLDGDIDLYPEYTSTGLMTVLGMQPLQYAADIVETVRSEYEERYELTWLHAAPFNNTQALAVTEQIAMDHGLVTYSDLAAAAPDLRLGGPAEFAEREDGLPGLKMEYGGFEFDEFVQLGTGPMRYDALQAGQIDVVVAFGTDGRISGDRLLVLQDDLGMYPIYQIAPVVRIDTLEQSPEIADALNVLAPLLTDLKMSRLNFEVDVEGREYPDVARDFLIANGLLSE